MSVALALRDAAVRLSATSDTARLDAEVLMAHALGVSRSNVLVRQMDRPAPPEFAALVKRREAHEPVAYIVGEQEFYGRSFRVSPDTLIPRSDSESVITAALEALAPQEGGQILDLGTGTGALLLSVLAERSDLRGLGVDRSRAALRVAKQNAQRHDLAERAQFREKAWCAGPDASWHPWTHGMETYDLILANPPYVETTAALDASVRDFEPHEALFAGPEGLDDYRIIIPSLRHLMREGAKAILEIGASQAQAVSEIAQNAGFSAEIRYDLANRPRVVILW